MRMSRCLCAVVVDERCGRRGVDVDAMAGDCVDIVDAAFGDRAAAGASQQLGVLDVEPHRGLGRATEFRCVRREFAVPVRRCAEIRRARSPPLVSAACNGARRTSSISSSGTRSPAARSSATRSPRAVPAATSLRRISPDDR